MTTYKAPEMLKPVKGESSSQRATRLEAQSRRQARTILSLLDELDEVKAAMRRYEVDAERYRWLRDSAPDEWEVTLYLGNGNTLLVRSSFELDEQIDAARGERHG